MTRITLPFPAPSLMPNRASGKHWTTTREAKNDAFTAALLASVIISAPHISKDTAERFSLALLVVCGLLAILKLVTA